MTLKDQIGNDVGLFLNENEFGDPATYNGLEITAVVEVESSMENGNIYTSDGQSARAIAFISVQDIPDPSQGDILNHQGTTWEVARLVSSDDALHELELTADERVGWPR